MARGFLGYTFYNFIKKDPKIDKIRTVARDEGFYGKKGDLKRLSLLTGVSATTYDNWFNGDTRRPTNAPMSATFAALGYKEILVRDREKKIDRESVIERAREKRRKAARKKTNGGRHG